MEPCPEGAEVTPSSRPAIALMIANIHGVIKVDAVNFNA
jgi:hypothetical protein